MQTDPNKIEFQEPFARSMATAARMWRRYLDLRFRDLDLSQARWNVLFELSRNEEVTRLLDGLEGAGLIERRPSDKDRRAKTLHLTEAATPLIVRMKEISGASRAEILEGISRHDLRIATTVLNRIAGRLEILNSGQNG